MTTIESLAAWLKQRDDIVLIGHVSPDGDACGSCMAMMLALKKLGKRACVLLPGGLPAMFARYSHAEEALSDVSELPFAPETAFALDISEKRRMGPCESIFDACTHTAMLDHHGTNTGFADIWHVDSNRAANGELVLELIRAMDIELDVEIAEWLYIAIMTDCGQFGFSNVNEDTFMAAAALSRTGIDTAKLTREIYHTRTKARTLLLANVLKDLQTNEDGTLAWARLTDEMLDKCGATREDNEGVVTYLVEIDTVKIAVLAEERANGTKFSLRSKGDIDVARDIAKPFGGGGHSKAAGVTIEEDMDTALKKVLEQAEIVLGRDGVSQ